MSCTWLFHERPSFSFLHPSMKGWDPQGETGPRKPLPDSVQIVDPPVDKIVSEPSSEQKEPTNVPPPPPVEDAYQQPQQEGFQEEGYAEDSAPPF